MKTSLRTEGLACCVGVKQSVNIYSFGLKPADCFCKQPHIAYSFASQ